MKPTSEILERIERCSSEHKDGVFTRLYRYLLREDIYYAAYQKLYANKGATTQGIDDDTADGFSDFYVKELIQSLKDGTYKANPVRRGYIPKKNGKLRPLGIPSFRDCYPAFYLAPNHATLHQIKKRHSINYSDGFFIRLLYAVPFVLS